MKQTFLTLGLCIIGGAAFSQHQPDSLRIVLHENQNGTLRVLDTIVPLSQQQALFTWMEANGWDTPPPPPPPGSHMPLEHVVIIDSDSGELHHGERHVMIMHGPCDSLRPPLPPHPPGAHVRIAHRPAPRDANGDVIIMRTPMPPTAPGTEVDVTTVEKDTVINGVTHKMIIRTERIILPEGVNALPAPPMPPKAPGTPAQMKQPQPAEHQKQLSVYPNPSTDMITVEFDVKPKEKTTLRVLDMNGKQVYTETIVDEAGKHVVREINLGGNAKGSYTVEVESAGKVIVQKVVLQ
jgi:hypothetical protein